MTQSSAISSSKCAGGTVTLDDPVQRNGEHDGTIGVLTISRYSRAASARRARDDAQGNDGQEQMAAKRNCRESDPAGKANHVCLVDRLSWETVTTPPTAISRPRTGGRPSLGRSFHEGLGP